MADLLARVDVKDLCAPVASSRDKTAIMAEAHAADHTLMCEVVYKVHIQSAVHTRIEHRMPVITLTLEVWRKLVRLQLAQLVANLLQLRVRVLEVWSYLLILIRRRGWSRDWAWACTAQRTPGPTKTSWRAWVRVCLPLLWRCWAATETRWGAANSGLPRSRACGRSMPASWSSTIPVHAWRGAGSRLLLRTAISERIVWPTWGA